MNASAKFGVWDWNGTLQDDLPVSIVGTNILLDKLGKPHIDAERYRTCFEVPIDRFYRNLGFSEQEIAFSLNEAQDTYFDTYEKLIVNVDFRPGGRAVLDFSVKAGLLNLILSNHITNVIEKDLQRLKKRDVFHEILAWPDREAQFHAPKSSLLDTFMRDHGLRPQNGIIVGDTPEEIKVARELKLISVALSGGYSSLASLQSMQPDYVISSLNDVKHILRERGFAS